MYIVYYWILHGYSISCKVEICSSLVTAPTSLIFNQAKLVTNDFNLVCVHIINKTTVVTNAKILWQQTGKYL